MVRYAFIVCLGPSGNYNLTWLWIENLESLEFDMRIDDTVIKLLEKKARTYQWNSSGVSTV